ncbi:hypothetical protein MMC06_002139 [Schaereria dolodes]|nr:hypothetical protein [Schaereria dolodes]
MSISPRHSRSLNQIWDVKEESEKSIFRDLDALGAISPKTAALIKERHANNMTRSTARPAQVIASLTSIVAATCAATTDEELLQCFYDQVQDKGASASWLSHILRELLARVSKPWLEQIGTCIGLVARNCLIESRNSLDNLFASQDSTSNRRIPNFISNADLETIRQTSESLDLLESHLPNHVLAQYGSVPCIQASELQWHFGEEDIERIQAKAKQYEASVLNAINANNDTLLVVSSSKPTTYSLVDVTPFEVSEDATEAQFNASYLTCKEPVDEIFPEAENDHYLETVLSAILTNSTAADTEENPQSALPLTISPLFSFSPIISIQARLVNRACLQMLFRDHQLRSHLSLQRRYYLFGDGMFASCLSHALFDAELESAERRSGHSWSEALGLKLGSRNTWPPTSSEIQLVLTGILEETYYYQAHDGDILPRDRDLPGGLSFAIRDLFEDELQRCLDPSSIAALDFLRLRYSPPPPLDSIITQSCLDKYDAIFKLLLRMARMLYVVNQLSRHSISRSRSKRPDPLVQRYHLEAYHFVSSISTYFLNIAVGANWEVFEQKLDEVEHDLDQDQSRLESSRPDGLHQLQEYHECMLDRMMYALFLRKRQEHLMKLLDDIFGAVLCFARSCTVGGIRDLRVDNTGMELKEQYQSFRKNVKGFISVCGGLADNGAHGSMRNKSLDKSGSSSLKHLLLTLEMNGYYSLQQ